MKGVGPAALQVTPGKAFSEARPSTKFVTPFTCKVPGISHVLTFWVKDLLLKADKYNFLSFFYGRERYTSGV